MTRQEPYTCDVCGKMFYVPQDPLQTLEINREQNDEIDYDLCFDCHDMLLKWILQRRKEIEEKKEVEANATG